MGMGAAKWVLRGGSEMSDAPTPETDAEYKEAQDYDPSTFVEPLTKFLAVERERDEARMERDELREKLFDSDTVMKWSASKVEELNEGLIRLVKGRNQAREIARLAFYIIRGVDPKFVKLAYERSVYWNGQEQPIQFMREAIKAWDKEQKEEA